MSSASAAPPPAASTKSSSPVLLKNEDVLVLILGWCPLKSIGRIGQCCKSLQSVLSDPNQQFWFGHLIRCLNIPSREVGNVNIASGRSAKSLLKTHAESIKSSPRGRPRGNESCWDYHRDDEPTLAIEMTYGGWDTYKIDHMVDEESSRYGPGHDFAARYRRSPVPHMPCPVVRRRSGGAKILDVGLSSISYFEVRLVSRTGQRQRRPNNAPPGDGEGTVQPQSQTCVAVGVSTSKFKLTGYQPGWTEDSLGFHSDDGSLFFGTGTDSEPFESSYGDGDVVGCGVHIPSMSVFFTKNGNFIGTAYIINTEPRTYREIYPSIGLDSKEYTVHASFGADQAFVFDVNKAERLYEAYPPHLRQSARLSNETHGDAPNPSDVLKRIGLECSYPEAAAFHPWNKTSPTRRIYVHQRDTRRYMWLDSEGESDEEDGHDDDSDGFGGNIDDGLEAMLSDAYDYVSYDDSTYGSGGNSNDDDDMDFDAEHDE